MKTNNDDTIFIYVQIFELYQKYYFDFLKCNKLFNFNKDRQDFLLKSIYNCVNTYIKYLNYKFNKNNPCLPLNLIKTCSEKGYITNSGALYSFFNNFNTYFYIEDTSLKEFAKKNILKTFNKSLLNNLKDEIQQNFSIEDYETIKNKLEDSNAKDDLSNKSLNFGLKNFEVYLLKYVFKSEESIKRVLLTGSRAKNSFTDFSDINLVLDCPATNFPHIQKKLQNLPLRYKITAICLNSKNFSDTLKKLYLKNNVNFYTKDESFPSYYLPIKDIRILYKYFCVENYRDRCHDFDKKLDNYDNNCFESQQEVIRYLGKCTMRYNKYLKIVLNEKGINELLPLKILNKCKELNLGYYIDWQIELMHKLRAYYDDLNSHEVKFEIGKNILSNLEDFYQVQIEMDKHKYKECLVDFLRVFDYTNLLKLNVNKDSVIYDKTISNLEGSSYNIILNYLKSNPKIKRVWLLGSRSQKYCHKGSDIDMMIDCSYKDYKKIKDELVNLNIPQAIDAQCINDKGKRLFCIRNTILGSKPFYDKSDFEIYWNSTKKEFNCTDINISNYL